MKPRGYVRSKRDVKNFNSRPKSHKYAQGIVHDGIGRGHTTVFDTGPQKSMIGQYGWEIIKRHHNWIDAQGVKMGVHSKEGRRLQLVYARGVVKKRLDRKRYLVILRQAF